MKNRVLNFFLLLAMVGMMFTACKKDYPEPPINELPVGTVYTIEDLLAMTPGTVFTEDASVYGIVTADEVSGNLYKAAFMQDRASGAAIELYMEATSGVRIGDSIRVYLKDVKFDMYNGLPQLSGFEADGHIVILANKKPIKPAEVTLADILTADPAKYKGALVKVKNVKFASINEQTTFAESNTYGNRTVVDMDNTDYYATVRTSNYANFAKNTLPQGTGNMVCIASYYATSSSVTWQFLVRSISELDFDGYVTTLPYFQAFTADFGSYTTYNVTGDQVWTIDYQTAKMTGNVNNTNHVNEDWLISAPVAISGIEHAKVRVNYAAQYQNSNTEDVTLQVSTNYVAGTDPLSSEVNWTQMNVTYPNTANWSDFQTIETSLDEFIGQTVTVAIKFLSSESQSRTMEIKFISVEEGEANNGGGGGGQGSGELQSLPYVQSFISEFGTYITKDVSGPQSWEIDYNTAKMTGYSGGSHANEDWLISSPVAITGVENAKISVTYSAQYQNADETDITLQVSTDYVYGNDPTTANWTRMSTTYPNTSSFSDFQVVETSLNDFIGQNVFVAIKYTSTDAQSRTIEIKSIAIEEGEAGGGGGGGGQGGELQNMPYTQSFASEFGTYITKDVSGPQSWMIDYHTAKMTGYAGSSHANEDWLISSPVAVAGVEHAKASVTYSAQYQNADAMDVTMMVSTDYVYGSDPNTANWTRMSTTYPNTSNFNDFQTVETSLDDFIGQDVYVAIRYTSTDAQSRTIEIQSITIQEGEAGGVNPPGPGPDPGQGEGSGTAEDPYNVAAGIGLQSTQPTAWVHGYIVGTVKSGDAHNTVTSNDDIDWAAPFGRATNVLIADDPNCNEVANCIIVKLPAGKPLRTQVNLVDHPENLGKDLAVLGVLKKVFGQQSGLSDSNGTEADFVLEGGVTPTPPEPGTGIFSETFANGQGQFTIHNVVLPSELTYVWTHDSSRKHMKASAFKSSTPYKAESWLVSPQIDLAEVSSATLSFEQAINYAEPQDRIHVMLSTNFTGEVGDADWTELSFNQWPVNDNQWVFVTSTVDLTPYAGQQVTIAFKYTSEATQEQCPTWEVKNVVVDE